MSRINKMITILDNHNRISNDLSYNELIKNNNFNAFFKIVNSEYDYLFSCGCYNQYDPKVCVNTINNNPDNANPDNSNYIFEHKIIDVEINNLGDLIQMLNDNPICVNVSYNIDLTTIGKIKNHIIELNNMIGMNSLKNHVLDQILYFAQGLHKNKHNSGDFMHTVIYGPPGTGKTEVAKILGKIYSKLGILKKGVFKKATRADLVAGYLGQTAIKTKELVQTCIGGVLFIDEAYSLGNEEKRDSFSKECIDTLCESLSDHKDNLMVIIAGYEKELNDCFFNYNQGLDSRFIWRFKIEEYTGEELMKIFIKKVIDNGWSIDKDTKITKEWFEKNLIYFKSYGRDMEVLFTKTKIAHSRRVFCKSDNYKTKITISDLNKGFDMFILNDNTEEIKHMTEKINSIYL